MEYIRLLVGLVELAEPSLNPIELTIKYIIKLK
jgi:hypothetical protein